MKVTVCFEDVRVIVPCGDGDILVRELIEKAILRYKKATGKSNNHWVSVHNVKAISGGGILDPDDQLNDVVDDREQLIADYEEHGRPGIHHNGGDGASASSTGTASPDIFHTGDLSHLNDVIHRPFPISQQNGKTDVIVTSRDLSVGTSLTVRRGSEPALNTLTDAPLENGNALPIVVRGRKESHQESDEPRSESESENDSSLSPPKLDSKEKSPLSRFQRDSKRLSLSNNPELYRWMDAHENQQDRLKQQQIPVERKGPIGGSGKESDVSKPQHKENDGAIVIVLRNDGGPLGIHVIPDIDDDGRELGLVLQGVEKGGRIERDGRLRVNDRIIEINGTNLEGVNFDSAQKIFRDAMRTAEVRLKVIKYRGPPLPKQPPPLMPKPKGHAPVKPSPLTLPPPRGDNSPQSSPEKTSTPQDTDKPLFNNNNNLNDKNVNLNILNNNKPNKMPGSPLPPRDKLPIPPGPPLKVTSPTKKTPPAVPQRHPSTTLSNSTPKDQAINTLTNTRKIGRKIQIKLQKGALGLGFSITSRDNMMGESPIYIKNILAKGAAVQDGRLKPGDRLLEVNGTEMMGKSQTEAVGLLRSIPEGHVCNLVVSRQEAVDELFRMPRELDGRLLINDQLLEVNHITLTSMSNVKAMDQLRQAMQNDGPMQGFILLTIARKIGAPSPFPSSENSLDNIDGSQLEVLNHGITIYKEKNHSRSSSGESPSALRPGSSGQTRVDNSIHIRSNSDSDRTKPQNPSLERVLVGTEMNGSHNESYNKVAHQNFEESQERMKGRQPQLTTVGMNNRGETVIIEDDMYAIPRKRQQPPRPHSTLGLPHISPSHSRNSSMEDHSGERRQRGSASDRSSEHHEETDLSPTGDFEFQREGFGRQSMSEKRKGHVDPRGSEFYQRAKEHRDSKGVESLDVHDDSPRLKGSGSMESLLSSNRTNNNVHDPSLSHYKRPFSQIQNQPSNLKRSSSYEELASSENVPQIEDKDVPMWRFARIGRPRACNDSFRAAVDRSYDAPANDHNVMDTLEEESMESNSLNHTQSNSARSSFSSENNNEDFHSLRKKKQKDKSRSVGILKGLIRLGKGRKSNEENIRRSKSAERPSDSDIRARQLEQERDRVLLGQQEQDRYRIREFMARRKEQEELEQQKRKMELQKQQLQQQQLQQQQLQQQQLQQQQLQQQQLQQQQQQQKQQQYLDQHKKLMQQNRPMFYDPQTQYGQEAFSHPADFRGGAGRVGNREIVDRGGMGPREGGERPGMGNRDNGDRGGMGMMEGHMGNRELEEWGAVGEREAGGGGMRGGERGMSRTDKIQQLRAQHQRQHQERQGHYPQEEKEEFYERQIQEEEKKRIMDRELAGRLQPINRAEMEISHTRMGSLDSASNFRQYPSVSETSDYSDHNSQHSHFSNTNYPHQRDRPSSRGPAQYIDPHQRDRPPSRGQGQYNDPHYHDRPPSRGAQQYNEDWYRGQPDFTAANRQTAFTRLNPQTAPNFYGDPARAYRDPKYPAVAGRRPVQTITDPSSAKV